MRAVFVGLVIATALVAGRPALAQSAYDAFGAKPGIEALMQDFVTRLQADVRIGTFFKGVNRAHLVAQLSEQVCEELGGPCRYAGPPMKLLHQDLAIRRADFNALVERLQDAMDARGIPFAAQNALLVRLAPMHRDIVERE